MRWVITALGVLLVAAVLRDIFHTLWHPKGDGAISRWLARGMWRVMSRLGSTTRSLAGPFILVGVIGTWLVTMLTGWALIYWVHLPDGFAISPDLDPSGRGGLLDAFYLSTVVLGTLGFGDIVPTDGWLRLVTAAQALVGFALLSAAVSWVLQIQPAVRRRRTLARHLTVLREAEDDVGATDTAASTLEGLTHAVVGVHQDLSQASPTYYFSEEDAHEALDTALPYAVELSARASRSDDARQRAAGAALSRALDGLAAHLGRRFLRLDAPRDEVLRRYAADHRHEAG